MYATVKEAVPLSTAQEENEPMQPSLQDFATSYPGQPALSAPPGAVPNGTPPPPLADPPARGRGLLSGLTMAEWLLKHREFLFAEIEAGREIQVILMDLLAVAVAPTAFYGLVVGLTTGSVVRMLSNPFKLPLMLFLTMCLCLPTLYIFSSYLGGRRTFLQTAALSFTGLAITGVILAAFAPITWFLTFTASAAHEVHVLVNVAVFTLAGLMGVSFLFQGVRRLNAGSPHLQGQLAFLRCWIVLYGLVGAQMGWLFRPFFSNSGEWIRPNVPGGENFFSAVLHLVQHLLR
jgi:hypothetical protein